MRRQVFVVKLLDFVANPLRSGSRHTCSAVGLRQLPINYTYYHICRYYLLSDPRFQGLSTPNCSPWNNEPLEGSCLAHRSKVKGKIEGCSSESSRLSTRTRTVHGSRVTDSRLMAPSKVASRKARCMYFVISHLHAQSECLTIVVLVHQP